MDYGRRTARGADRNEEQEIEKSLKEYLFLITKVQLAEKYILT
jgi:hypothetical protein